MTLALYHGLASTCSKKVRMCLFEKGLEFESHVLNLQKFEQHDPEYLKLNPKGVVPTLVHDGQPIIESSRIIEYIDQTFPDPSLHPENPEEQARMRKWIDWSDNVGYNAVYIPTWEMLSAPVAKQLSDENLTEVLERVPTEERRSRWRAVAREGFSREDFDKANERMIETLEEMEGDLVAGPWLAGITFSLGDIAMIPFIERMFDLRPDLQDETKYPLTCAWYERMESRPTFKNAFFFDGVDTRTNAIRRQHIEAGLIPRE